MSCQCSIARYRIRKGKSVGIRWKITTNGADTALEGRDLRLEIVNPYHKRVPIPFTVEGNMIRCSIYGPDQVYLGDHKLTLWENYGKNNQTVIDANLIITFVATTHEESFGLNCHHTSDGSTTTPTEDSSGATAGVNIELTSALLQLAGSDGKPGRDGKNGLDGYTPQKGIDYFDGERGPVGPQGPRGFQGVPGPQGPKGEPGTNGDDGVGIASVVQVETSEGSGDINVVRITLTNGKTHDIIVRNGNPAMHELTGIDDKLSDNTIYRLGTISELDLPSPPEDNTNGVLIYFTASSSGFTFTYPVGSRWMGDFEPSIQPDCSYQILVLNGIYSLQQINVF